MVPSVDPTRQRSFDLPLGLRVETIADQARFAAMMIMGAVREGWSKPELAHWLVGPYARATEAARWASTPGTLPPKPPVGDHEARHAVTEDEVNVVLKSAHASVVECVRYARSWQQQRGFAKRMVDEGLVVGVLDGQMLGYAPIDHRRMRLVDRIRSLFVADYLTRPGDYRTFQVCDCGLVTFDPAPAHYQDCERPRESGIMRKVVPPADAEAGTSLPRVS